MNTKIFTKAELARREKIRVNFSDVDGPALLATAKPKGMFSKVPQSIYAIPLKSTDGSESFIEFGPRHDSEFSGARADNTGMVLWCSGPDYERFADLAMAAGVETVNYCNADSGTIIHFGRIDNTEVIQLSMKMFQTLCEAFEITNQEVAITEHRSMAVNVEKIAENTEKYKQTL